MKLSQILLAASCASSALASAGAGGWEAVAFYYSYRMDVETGGNNIAPKCKGKGTHSKGGCNFPEFIDHIQKKPFKMGNPKELTGRFDQKKMPSDIDKENPDPEKASKIMEWEGTTNPSKKPGDPPFFKYNAAYEPEYVAAGGKNEDRSNHGAIMKYVGGVVDGARKKDTAGKLGDYVTNVKNCMGHIILARIEEFEIGLKRDFDLKVLKPFNDRHGNSQVQSEEKKVTHPGTTKEYTVFDAEKTLDNLDQSGNSDADKTSLRNSIVNFGTDYKVKTALAEKKGSSGVSHWRDITAIQDVHSRLDADPGTYCDTY